MRISTLPQLTILLCVSLSAGTPAWPAPGLLYDAGLGTLPESQGFMYVNSNSGAPAPSVSAGILSQGPTPIIGFQYWIRLDVPFRLAEGTHMEIEMKTLQSDYVLLPSDGSQRSGFYAEVVDSAGRRLTLGIATTGITVNTDRTLLPANGIPFFPFNSGDAFHHYDLFTTADSIHLFIDGALRGATVLGDSIFTGSQASFYFGDGTTAAGSQVQIRSVNYTRSSSPAGVEPPAQRAANSLRIVARNAVARGGAEFSLIASAPEAVRVKVVDAAGRMVRDLGAVMPDPTGRALAWDGRDAEGRNTPAGLYFAVASGASGRAACKFALLH
jgi:hypothetical protein